MVDAIEELASEQLASNSDLPISAASENNTS